MKTTTILLTIALALTINISNSQETCPIDELFFSKDNCEIKGRPICNYSFESCTSCKISPNRTLYYCKQKFPKCPLNVPTFNTPDCYKSKSNLCPFGSYCSMCDDQGKIAYYCKSPIIKENIIKKVEEKNEEVNKNKTAINQFPSLKCPANVFIYANSSCSDKVHVCDLKTKACLPCLNGNHSFGYYCKSIIKEELEVRSIEKKHPGALECPINTTTYINQGCMKGMGFSACNFMTESCFPCLKNHTMEYYCKSVFVKKELEVRSIEKKHPGALECPINTTTYINQGCMSGMGFSACNFMTESCFPCLKNHTMEYYCKSVFVKKELEVRSIEKKHPGALECPINTTTYINQGCMSGMGFSACNFMTESCFPCLKNHTMEYYCKSVFAKKELEIKVVEKKQPGDLECPVNATTYINQGCITGMGVSACKFFSESCFPCLKKNVMQYYCKKIINKSDLWKLIKARKE